MKMCDWLISIETLTNPAYVCVCLQLVAEDVDSQLNGAILYSIISGDRGNQFFIDPLHGVIKVNKQLDRETVRSTHTYTDTHTHTHTHTDTESLISQKKL